MSSVVAQQASRTVSKPVSTGRILSAADYAGLITDENRRRSDGECRVDRLPSLHEEAHRHGYRQGMRHAFADLNETLVELRRCRDDRSVWLQSFAFAILSKVLGAHDASSLVPAIVQQAIEECERSLETIAVHVHPDAAAEVAKRVNRASTAAKQNGLHVDIVADERLNDTACEIHTPFGIIDAGLDTQLDALAEALGE